jgi:uncharacterized membrane protein YkvA (DUF1232 family)
MSETTENNENEAMEMTPTLLPDRKDAGFWREFWRQMRLVWYLFRDQDVPVYLKTLPVAAVLYTLMPLDLIPDWIVGLGQLDDLMILLLGGKVFIELAPPEIVARYLKAMRQGEIVNEIEAAEEEADISQAIILNPDHYQVNEKDQAE